MREGGRKEREKRKMEEKEGTKGTKGLLSRLDLRVVKEKEDESCGWKGGRSHTCGLGVVSLIRPSKCSLLQRRLCVNKHVKKLQLCVCDCRTEDRQLMSGIFISQWDPH